MGSGIKVGLIDRSMAVKEFIIATANYLLAEEAAREALEASGLDPNDYPFAMMADVEIIEPIS